MTGFFKTKILNIILGVSVATLVFSSYLVFVQIQHLITANIAVVRAHQIIGKTNQTLLDIIDGERLEHEYFSTNNVSLLPIAQQNFVDTQAELIALRALVTDDKEQSALIDGLVAKAQARARLFTQVVAEFKVSGALAHYASNNEIKEQQLTDQIKTLIALINQREYRYLEERNKQAMFGAHQTFLTVVMFGKLGGVTLLLSFLLLNYQAKKNNELQLKINRELVEQNKRVNEATRLKSEFLANMSHELRTPLNAIIGFSEMIQDREVGPTTPEQEDFLKDILASARHLLRLINDVLDLSKVEAGKMEFDPENVHLPTLVNEVVELLHPLFKNKRISLQTQIDAAVDAVFIDASRFKQVLYNYLSNAIKFTPEYGQVTVTITRADEAYFRLAVKDTGIGIHPSDVKRLFAEFQQLDASSTKKYAGTGLGLALTKQIIEAQGGHVGVVSTLGEGSMFYAVLPMNIPLS